MSILDWMQVVMLSLHHKRQVTGLLGPGPIISQQQVIILYLQETTDNAGNVQWTATIPFTVTGPDTIRPTVAVTSPTPNSSVPEELLYFKEPHQIMQVEVE